MSNLKHTGFTQYIRHIKTSCDKQFTGSKNKVSLQMKLHMKVCDKCKDAGDVMYTSFNTELGRSNQNIIDKEFNHILDKLK